MKGHRSIFVAWLAVSLGLSACGGSRVLTVPPPVLTEEFVPSLMQPAQMAALMKNEPVRAVKGRARVQLSSPGNSERGSADFIADRSRLLISLRNNLGIEGGHVLADPDSVLLYYSIDKVAWKLSVEDYETMPDISLRLPLNLLDVLSPVVEGSNIGEVLENASQYLIKMNDGVQVVVDKQTKNVQTMRYPSNVADRFSEFVYEGYATLNGQQLPRRIQALTTDRRSQIRFDVRELKLNPSEAELRFVLDIPPGIHIYR